MSRGAYLARTRGGTQTGGRTQTTSQTGQSGGPAGMTFTESVSNPNIGVTQQEAQQQQQQFQTGDTSSTDTSGQTNVTTTDDKDKNILQEAETMLGDLTTAAGKGIQNVGNVFGLDFPAFGFTGILQGLNANNKFFDRLIDGNVDAKDRVTLVGLLKANADNPRVFDQALEQYADRNNLSPDQRIALTDSFKSEVAGLERREEDFEKLVEQYESGRPKGFKEGVLSLT